MKYQTEGLNLLPQLPVGMNLCLQSAPKGGVKAPPTLLLCMRMCRGMETIPTHLVDVEPNQDPQELQLSYCVALPRMREWSGRPPLP